MKIQIKYLIFFVLYLIFFTSFSQVNQTLRYEIEKKNTDDFFTVISARENGLFIIRDTDEYRKDEGNYLWEITILDTLLEEVTKHEIGIESEYIFKGYDYYQGQLFLLFRDGDFVKSDFLVVTVNIMDGEVQRYNIENEIDLELSHMIIVNNYIILGGYVRYSPTLVSYRIGSDKIGVIPGYFKDRSDIIDLRTNNNGTFNVLTLEKDYEGFYIKLRTYAPEGDILFEKSIKMEEDYRALDGKSTDFVGGNIAVTGTYSTGANTSAQGIYFTVVKPEGQKDQIKYYDFPMLEHFFDYKGPKRSERIRNKIDRKISKGKKFKYSSRLLLHDVEESNGGYLLAAEIFDPKYENLGSRGFYSSYYGYNSFPGQYGNTANQRYVKRPSGVRDVEEANHFDYLGSILLKLDATGNLVWDNSLSYEDVESYSLEPVMDFNKNRDQVNLLFKSDEQLNYKIIEGAETVLKEKMDIKLLYGNDEIKSNFDGVGGTEHWYGNNYFIWGYHRIGNKENNVVDDRRNVLFINKLTFEN